jgi:NAD(P)-dependent dehydrogenase (short-subunit alcohol dehydrogenase family)
VAIITGGGRGIGKAFALRFADEGAKILIPDLNLGQAQQTASEIQKKGCAAVAIQADVASESSTQQMAERAVKEFGRIDILVNNAAIWAGLDITPWDAWKPEDWDRIFSVNVKGIWLCCKAVAPVMTKQGKGKIINIASAVARVPASQVFLPYAVSKGAVYTLTHSLARALGPAGINVNAIAPGYVASEASLAQRDSAGTFKLAVSEQSLQRREEPSDLVGTAVFLSSADSDFMSGQVLYVDGGTVML